MTPSQTSLVDLLGSDKREFFCPPIQREYVWDRVRRKALLDDLFLTIETGEGRHYTGTIITAPAGQIQYSPKHQVTRVLVVDGQQRLTTLSILLAVSRRRLAGIPLDDDELIDKVRRCLFSNKHPKLVPTEADREEYSKVLEGDYSGKREISKAAKQFEQQFKFLDDELFEALVAAALSSTLFVVISLSQDEDPCEFFAAANGRGTPLTPAELTKNLLLMKSGEPELSVAADKFWRPLVDGTTEQRVQELISEVTYLRHGWLSKASIYRIVEKDLKELGLQGYFDLLSAWKRAFLFVESKIWMTKSLGQKARNALGSLSSYYAYLPGKVIWVAPVRLFVEGKISEDDLACCVSALENYYVRCITNYGAPIRDFPADMGSLCSLSGEAVAQGYKKILMGCPAYKARNNEALRSVLTGLRFCRSADKAWARAVLQAIEERTQKDIQLMSPTLEHIAPQKLDAPGWNSFGDDDSGLRHSLGNLTLLSGADNGAAGRASFDEKRRILLSSPYELNRAIARDHTSWGPLEIEERSRTLIDFIIRIWPHTPQ